MNRKSLYIAMALVLPSLVAVGCKSTTTRSIAEEEIKVEETQYQLEQIQQEEAISDVKESETPVEVVSEIVLAETEIPEAEQTIDLVTSESVVSEPKQLTVYFDTNKTDVKQDDYESLIMHAEYLMKHPDIKLKLIGHTDQSGDTEYNKQFAMKRSKSVEQVLVDYGVQPSQIITESLGEEYPISGFEHAIYDRRVELEYMHETQLTER